MIPRPVVDALADMNVSAAVCLAVSLFSASLVPFFLLVNADFAAAARRVWAALEPSREACRDAAALILLLTTSPKGAMAS